MRTVLVVCALAAALQGCSGIIQSSVLARPSIVYSSGSAIGVEYVNIGVQASFNQQGAMDLISNYCHGQFRVTGRSERDRLSYVDAVCTNGG